VAFRNTSQFYEGYMMVDNNTVYNFITICDSESYTAHKVQHLALSTICYGHI